MMLPEGYIKTAKEKLSLQKGDILIEKSGSPVQPVAVSLLLTTCHLINPLYLAILYRR